MNRPSLLFLSMVMAICTATAESRYWNQGRGYAPFSNATPSGILLDNNTPISLLDSCNLQQPSSDFTLSFRVDNRNSHPSRKYPHTDASGQRRLRRNPEWGFFLIDCSGHRLYITVSSREITDALSSTPATAITLSYDRPGFSESKTVINNGSVPFAGETLWHMTLKSGKLIIGAGAHDTNEVVEYALPDISFSTFGYISSPSAKIMVSDISLTTHTPHSPLSISDWTDGNELDGYLQASEDVLEGYWGIFDRSLEESLLMLGGDYRCAIVKEGNRYALIYLAGARVNAGAWKSGMVKAYLTPTVFPGVYDVEWFDSEGNPLKHEVKGQYGDGDTFTIQFPYQDSTLRLRKASPAS